MDHIGENAELYALGALDEDERIRTEDHVRYCLPCMKLLGNAEQIISDLEFEMPPLHPPPRLEQRILKSACARAEVSMNRPMTHWRPLAAMLLLGIVSIVMGLGLWQRDRQVRQNDAILSVLASSESGQVSLRMRATTEPVAKAVCEKNGKWIYLIVAKANPDLVLYGERDGSRESLGRPVSQGQSATLFVESPGKFSALELMANGRVVATARTHYPR